MTIISFVVMAGLIVFKPRENMEQVQYVPALPPAQENVEVPKDTKTKKSTSKTTGTASNQASGEKSLEVSGNAQGTSGKNLTGIQGAAGDSLQNKNSPGSEKEYRDPVLEEILKLKQQAEESNNDTASQESSSETSDEVNAKPGESSDKKDIQQQNAQETKASIQATYLNVRDKAGMDGGIVGTLSTGDIVEIIDKGEAGEWLKIKLSNGKTGWVMKKYLKLS
jgi:hypothetical protein